MNTVCTIYISLMLLCAVSACLADDGMRNATILDLKGEVMIKNAGQAAWRPAKVSDILAEGSFVKTGPEAKAVIRIDDGDTAVVDVGEKSLVSFTTLIKEASTGIKKTLLDLSIGQVLVKAEKLDTPDSKFEVKTPTSVVGVRGTRFSVKVDALK